MTVLKSCNSQRPNKLIIKLIATTDVHGAILPYDFILDASTTNSLSQVYSFVKEERKNSSQEVIFLDNGDFLQGQPIVYFYNFENPNAKHICSEVMNYMKYDAASVGNHDIEAGHSVYDKLKKELHFPWLAANIIDTLSKKPYFQPYTIIKRRGIKIAILGMITPAVPNWLPQNLWAGMKFEDIVISAKKWQKIIQEKENPDILIGLFHSGVDYNYYNQTADSLNNENAAKIVAERVEGFDVIIAGHDHQKICQKIKNASGKEVLLLDPSYSAKELGVVSIELIFNEKEQKYEKIISGNLVNVSTLKPDEGFLKRFEYPFSLIKKYVEKPVCVFSETVTSRESLFGPSAFVDLIHQLQLDLTAADISLATPLSYDSQINKGQIFVRDLFKLYKYENLLYTMELSGQEIKNYLEFSVSLWFNQMSSPNDNLLRFKKDDKMRLFSQFYNFSSAAGIIYEIDVRQSFGKRVNIKTLQNGKPFDLTEKYRVAINSYQGNGGGNLLTDGAKIPHKNLAKRILKSTEKDIRFYLMKWLEKKQTYVPTSLKNWQIIPQDWAEKGKKKDYEILFEKNEK